MHACMHMVAPHLVHDRSDMVFEAEVGPQGILAAQHAQDARGRAEAHQVGLVGEGEQGEVEELIG